MRLLRLLATTVGCAVLISHTSAAQGGRQFKDAWFWGLKTGAVSYSSASTNDGGAPFLGAEWLITRTYGGLYISYDESFFNTRGGIVDRDPDSTSAFLRPVDLHNLRRYSVAAMVFPYQTPKWHPYGGIGFQLNAIASATALGPFANNTRVQIAADSVQARKSAFAPVFILGTQLRLNPFSVFAQGTASPATSNFFLWNPGGKAMNVGIELGIRYNVGSSIERQRP